MTPLQVPAPPGADGFFAKAAAWLLGIAVALATALWGLMERRVGKLEAAVATKAEASALRELERTVDAKADAGEMNRQRDNIGEIFGELRDMRKQSAEQHAANLTATYTLGTELRKMINEVTLERRAHPREEHP